MGPISDETACDIPIDVIPKTLSLRLLHRRTRAQLRLTIPVAHGFVLPQKSRRDVDPAGFDLRLIAADGFHPNVLHLHAHVLHKCGQSGRKALSAHVRWNRAGECLAGRHIKLSAVHGARDELAVERAHFQRGIHVSAASLDGVVSPVAIADDDLPPAELDGFHAARRDRIGADCGDELVTHGPRPLAKVGGGCPGR